MLKIVVCSLVALFCAFPSANAALMTYDIVYFDNNGANIGSGSFSFDNENLIDLDDFCDASCRFIAGDETDFAEYSPLQNLVLEIGPFSGPPVAGNFGWAFGQIVTVCFPGERNCGQTPGIGPGWVASNFGGTFFMQSGKFEIAGGGGIINGTYELIRTPLPASIWLFVAGLFVLLKRSYFSEIRRRP
ncbi:MAG: hypothetical protein ACX939_05890 [Hyphococcus sp.]